MEIGIFISLGAYFVAMLAIGYYSYVRTNNDVSGFMLGGRSLGPSVTALSAGASDMSGWLLMGLPGALYVSGLANVWLIGGLIIGAYLNYLCVAPRLRLYTEIANDSVTIPEFFENRFADNSHLIRLVCAVVIVVFFAIYTTSGVVAGGKLFESSFGLDYNLGVFVTAGVVVAYSTFGGFLAVSTTDFIQGCIMFVALILVPIVALTSVGGVGEATSLLDSVNPGLLSIEGMGLIGIVSAAGWGLGYFGQPHIIVRFMAIRSVSEVKTARRIGMSWMVVSLIGACMVGLSGVAYIAKTGGSLADPETIFIFFATTLFHPLISGFLLAAILAAIMSTISSQLLVTSSSLVEDIVHTFFKKDASSAQRVVMGRIAVVAVALLAVVLAQDSNNTILSLVSNAWAGFGAAFGPVVILSLFWRRMTRSGAMAGIVTGALTVLVWIYAPLGEGGSSLSAVMYELVPGFILAFVAIVVVSLVSKEPSAELQQDFEEMKAGLKEV